ncbi:MAG: hypothetical protein NWT00_00005, partial [Beijerinckiaceae bacterium]|nr:hypothetical protein [Beijerinckiaceae bacterium]
WPKVVEALRPIVLGARFVSVSGRLQNEAGVIHVIAERMENLTPLLGLLSGDGGQISALANADEVKRPQHERNKNKIDATPLLPLTPPTEPVANNGETIARILPGGRNFH